MLAALGILAYAASTMTHEALGHGSSCLLVGGRSTLLTPWMQTCEFPAEPRMVVKAAGPAVQFGAGLIASLILHLPALRSTTTRYFLWLLVVFNLLISTSYVAFSGFTHFGDAAELIAGHQPRLAWHISLVLIGAVTYFLAMQLSARELRRFAGLDFRQARLFRLVWIPYLSAGVFALCTAATHRTPGAGLACEMAALSSFASGAGIFWLPEGAIRIPFAAAAQSAYLRWSRAWGIAAAVVVLVFLLFLGPGLH